MADVILQSAFFWQCPNCGLEQFGKAPPFELSAEEMREMDEEAGINPDELKENHEGHEWVFMPEHVTCTGCKQRFSALYSGEIDTTDFDGGDTTLD